MLTTVAVGAIMYHRLSILSRLPWLPSAISPHPYTTQYIYGVFLRVVEDTVNIYIHALQLQYTG